MTSLPYKIYINDLETYDILRRGIQPNPLKQKRRRVNIDDIYRVINLGQIKEITPEILSSSTIASLVIMNDLTYTAKSTEEDKTVLEENQSIEFADGLFLYVSERGEYVLTYETIYSLVDEVNRLYEVLKKTMSNNGSVIAKIDITSSRYFGESMEIVYPSSFGTLTRESSSRLVFDDVSKKATTKFTNLHSLRNMTLCLLSKSVMRRQPTILLMKNSTLNDFTASKYKNLITNSVFQIDSDMKYTKPIQHTEHIIENDIIRSVIAPKSTNFLKNVFGDAFTSSYINTAIQHSIDSNSNTEHIVNITSSIGFVDIVAFASNNFSMTQVYLPVQSVVCDRKINCILLSAYYEAFAHIALINNQNTGKPVNLILKYPTTSMKEEFDSIMVNVLAIIKNRPVTIVFYDTDESVLENSIFKHELL